MFYKLSTDASRIPHLLNENVVVVIHVVVARANHQYLDLGPALRFSPSVSGIIWNENNSTLFSVHLFRWFIGICLIVAQLGSGRFLCVCSFSSPSSLLLTRLHLPTRLKKRGETQPESC